MPTVEALNHTYVFLKRFSMPNGDGTADAVTVSLLNGQRIHSAYTLMIKICVMQFWSLVVLCGVAFFIRQKGTHNRHAATVGIWNAQASPTNVAMLTARYIFHMRGDIWYPIGWTLLAVLIIATSTIAPILLTNFIELGQVAPVDPASIFVPDISGGLSNTQNAQFYVLQNPATFRAAAAGMTPKETVSVTQEGTPQNVTINYGYNVTGTDFGLQHVPELVLYVEGSCATEYGWLQPQANPICRGWNDNCTIYDDYYLYDDPGNQVTASSSDGGPPFPIFQNNKVQANSGNFNNFSYAIVISSVWRYSFSPSSDPWYLTSEFDGPGNDTFPWIVLNGRPVLSCWETNRWSYGGKDGSFTNLVDLTGGKLSSALQQTFANFLGTPMIGAVGLRLGRSALTAAASGIGNGFDAKQSSIYKDMERLVLASYAATVNVLAETTMFQNPQGTGLHNRIQNNKNEPLPGADDFVVFSSNVTTLSVKTLIIVPVILCFLLALNILVGIVPTPWRMTHALHASVLYSHLQEMTNQPPPAAATPPPTRPGMYTRTSYVAFTKDPTPAGIHPSYTKDSGLTWQTAE